MADLTAGTRVQHKRWLTTGTVKVEYYGEGAGGPLVHVPWDGSFVDDEISESGPVLPEDLEIIGRA
jgi:hypothetical protein